MGGGVPPIPTAHPQVPLRTHPSFSRRAMRSAPQGNGKDEGATHEAAAQERGEVVTGLLYVSRDPHDCHEILATSDTPLNALDESVLCPGSTKLMEINQSFR